MKMKINKVHRFDPIPTEGVVIVIDVIRAFTTAAYAFNSGANEIVLVGTVEDALSLKKRFPDSLLMGEVEGYPIPEFHFGNSPVQLSMQSLQGRRLIQRTSSGTQGVLMAGKSERILVGSFVVAKATLDYLKLIAPDQVTFVITGFTKGGEEDMAFADYMEKQLQGESVDPKVYLDRVVQSPTGQDFASGQYAHCPSEDLSAILDIDRFQFAMEVFKEDGLFILRKIVYSNFADFVQFKK